MVQLWELSAGRQALEGACLAPGDKKTLEALKDPDRCPALPRNSVPDGIAQFAPVEEFSLAQDLFLANVCSARRGAAPGSFWNDRRPRSPSVGGAWRRGSVKPRRISVGTKQDAGRGDGRHQVWEDHCSLEA